MSLVLDTTVLIDLLRGRAGAVERLAQLRQRGEPPLTTPVNVEEIHRGLRSRERDAARQLFEGLQIVAIGRVEGERAGDWRRDYAEAGVTLAQADCLIAAAAATRGVALATGNPRHFPMPDVRVEHWPAGI